MARYDAMRRCGGCGAAAVRCEHVTAHYRGWMGLGESYRHRCGACGVTFVTLSAWRTLVEGGAALLLGVLAATSMFLAMSMALQPSGDPSLRWKMSLFSAALGVGLFVAFGFTIRKVVRSILSRARNPVA